MLDDNITRAEFVQILGNISRADVGNMDRQFLVDMHGKDWFFGAVVWANENGISSGSGGNFTPNAYITREEMTVI